MDFICKSLLDLLIENAGKVLVHFSGISLKLFENEIVNNVLDLFEYFGYILLVIGICFAIANVYINYLEGNGISVHLLIVNILKAIIAIKFLRIGAIAIFQLSLTMQDLLSKVVTSNKDYNQLIEVMKLVMFPEMNALWSLIILIIVLVSMFIVLFQALKRAGIYFIHIVIGYLYIFAIPNGNTDGFMDWGKQTVALAVTNTLQVGLLLIGMKLMNDTITSVFLGIGVLMSATSVEKVAGRFGMTANSRQSLGGAVRTARTINSAVKVIKSIK